MTNLLCDSIDFATKFEEDKKSETYSVQFKQQIKTRVLARITLHSLRLVLPRTSLVFLKIPACLYNSTMHSARFFYFFTLSSAFDLASQSINNSWRNSKQKFT